MNNSTIIDTSRIEVPISVIKPLIILEIETIINITLSVEMSLFWNARYFQTCRIRSEADVVDNLALTNV